ncbi:MAG TPA: nucleoside diphosphate kinase regulator [Devosia sp.]|jgi:regulator of nucleoside diphosphate kinase|nr:nucleoside diphosphate kinase regulator [Devosia sp.]
MTALSLWLSPNITLSTSDHQRLSLLALSGPGSDPDAADDLLHELDRASIVTDASLPGDVVRMGSLVRFRAGRDERTALLVYPAEADIASGRISVLTPVGAALIGLRTGQSISFRTRDGRPQMLTVLRVLPPPSGDEDDDGDGPQAA